MLIVTDENIPFIADACAELGDVVECSGREITRSRLKYADALFVRSITRVDEQLLRDTAVSFVGTATIGTDHIDLAYLKKRGITFASAPGSNARSVAEYVFTSIIHFGDYFKKNFSNMTIGIIGAGNVGNRVKQLSQALGLQILLNDPPLGRAGSDETFHALNTILENSDIITLHVPLTYDGPDPTFHLADKSFFSSIKQGAMFINTSRGAVVDEKALLQFRNKLGPLVLDVWENEPKINHSTIDAADIATPHIAGYSYDGKLNGAQLIYEAFCSHIRKNPAINILDIINREFHDFNITRIHDPLKFMTQTACPILSDDQELRKIVQQNSIGRSGYFDSLRKNYRRRLEFPHFKIHGINDSSDILKSAGFSG
ncbi:MAG TPA: 4-phosphoerythronate dehydrogenase [Chitinispirillaceae bacterium]|nr:4-phosphoerythronate dehydrogenase [Chitinispirillaceae bacterium]